MYVPDNLTRYYYPANEEYDVLYSRIQLVTSASEAIYL